MMKLSPVITAAGLSLLVTTCVQAKPLPQAPVICHRAPGANQNSARILIIGESWASKGKMLPNLPEAAAKRLGPVIACSVGFSGRNTSDILREYSGAKEAELLKALGGRPTYALILTGVNDQVQHVGAKRHASDVTALAGHLRRSGSRVLLVEAPYISPNDGAWLGARLKHTAARYANDGGAKVVTATYRAAVAKTGIETIAFDPFIPAYAGNESRYQSDGIHLTPAWFSSYATYLGDRLALKVKLAKRRA